VGLLQQLAAAAEVFIPTTSLLLDCLEWKEWHLKPKKTKVAVLEHCNSSLTSSFQRTIPVNARTVGSSE
jgi:hypothetical protein